MVLGPASDLELVFGAMGGEGQPQTQAALVTRVFDQGLDVQAAVDVPRRLYGRTWGDKYRGLRLEGQFGEDVARELVALGDGKWTGDPCVATVSRRRRICGAMVLHSAAE